MKKFKITYNAPITLTFALLCLLVVFIKSRSAYIFDNYFVSYFTSFTDWHFYWRMISYVFGHSDWNHFINNIIYILLLGPMLEKHYKSKNLAIMFFITAVAGSLINALLYPSNHLYGASGIVFMMITLSSIADAKDGEIPITMIVILVLFFSGQIYNSLVLAESTTILTQVIGGICGIIFGTYLFNA